MAAKKITKFKAKKGTKSAAGPGIRSKKKPVASNEALLLSPKTVVTPDEKTIPPSNDVPNIPPVLAPEALPKVAVAVAPPPQVSQTQTMGPLGSKTVYTTPAKAQMEMPSAPPLIPPVLAQKKGATSNRLPAEKPQTSVVAKQLELKTEELTDQVNNMLEVADSLLDPNWTPETIIDVVHVLVRSLNLDVVTMVLPTTNESVPEHLFLSRGYENTPGAVVRNLWLGTFDKISGIDWSNLMHLAEDNKSDLAYWIVQESLDSIGYVPIRDGNFIYGFIFVASLGKKEQSTLTAALLDLCGSHIGLAYALKFNK